MPQPARAIANPQENAREDAGPNLRRLCFGGSFNPIHNGHLRCAEAAAKAGNFGAVILIPAAQPPHKPKSPDLACAADRLAMTKLAAESVDRPDLRFIADDLEISRAKSDGAPSYTLDTARELKRRGFSEVNWLIGADMLNYLPKWHKANELIEEVNFFILARPGVELEWDKLSSNFRSRLEKNVVPAPLIDISATQIRQRVRDGLPIDDLVPQSVARYIKDHKLYV